MENLIFPQYRILIVDDEPHICELVRLYLEKKRFQVSIARNGEEALRLLERTEVHLIVLDIMMPEMTGWELCQKIREDRTVPLLMLTARGEKQDKVDGLSLGADDYLVKPFDPNELVARVISLLRRTYLFSQPAHDRTRVIQIDTLKIDTESYTVTLSGELIDLTPREYQLLLQFVRHRNQVLSREQLIEQVWGYDYEGDDRVVDVTVKRLRKKLEDEIAMWSLETVRGIGYKFQMNAHA